MQILFALLIFGLLLSIIGFVKLRLWQFHAVLAAGIGMLWLVGLLFKPWVLLPVVLLLSATVIISVSELRQRLLTRRLFSWFERVLPPISATEKTAIDAGTVWWDRELFSGAPNWPRLLNTPTPALSAEEQAFLDGPTETLCQMLNDWQITAELNDLPPDIWQLLKQQRFFGLIVPKEYGGLGFSALANSAVVMKIASRSITAAVTVMVPNSLGPAELLVHYGTQAQRDHYLPRLANGEDIPCFALTAPSAGSDAGAIPDTGIVCYGEYQGEQVLGLRVSWDKRYITLGPIATVLGLAFKAYDPDGLLGEQQDLGITCALIPVNTPGVNIGQRHLPLNIPFMNGPNSGQDVFVPFDWVIGGQQGLGDGWRMLMGCLAAGRAISLPALGAAAGKVCTRYVGAYARIRRQFKLPIGKFEGVAEALARMAGLGYLMDAGRIMTAGAIDQGEKPTVLSAVLKYHNTEAMRTVVNDAMDVLGGKGICLGPKNLIGRIYQAVPISITVEGANILTRSMIIFGQGVFRCHPYVLTEMDAVADPDKQRGFAAFDKAILGHIGFSLKNAIRMFLLGFSGARLLRTPVAGATAIYFRNLTRFAAVFTVLSDLSMLLLGGSLKRKESLSARLGDCLSFLYYGSAVLKHYQDTGQPAEDLPLVHWTLQYTQHRIQTAVLGVLQNFPLPWLGGVLQYLIFPWGARFQPPSDALSQQVANLLLAPGASRDRLTNGVFVSQTASDVTAQLEAALVLAETVAPIERKLRQATGFVYQTPTDEAALNQAVRDGLLTEDEAESLRQLVALSTKIIQVDDFDPTAVAAAVFPSQAKTGGEDQTAAA